MTEVTTTEYVERRSAQGDREIPRLRQPPPREFHDYAKLMKTSPRYTGVREQRRSRRASRQGLQSAGYATDPAYPTSWRARSTPPRCGCSGPRAETVSHEHRLMSRSVRAMNAARAGDDIPCRPPVIQHRQRQHRGLSRQSAQMADQRRPVHRRRFLRQGRQRRHGAARAQPVPRREAATRRPAGYMAGGRRDARSSQLQQLQKVFPLGEEGPPRRHRRCSTRLGRPATIPATVGARSAERVGRVRQVVKTAGSS